MTMSFCSLKHLITYFFLFQFKPKAEVSRKYHQHAKTLIRVAGLIEGYNPNCWKYSGSRFDNVKEKKFFYLSLYLQSKI